MLFCLSFRLSYFKILLNELLQNNEVSKVTVWGDGCVKGSREPCGCDDLVTGLSCCVIGTRKRAQFLN